MSEICVVQLEQITAVRCSRATVEYFLVKDYSVYIQVECNDRTDGHAFFVHRERTKSLPFTIGFSLATPSLLHIARCHISLYMLLRSALTQ